MTHLITQEINMNEISKIDSKELIFSPENLTKETIKKYLCPEASDQELIMGLQIAKTFNLNPLKREVYFIKYKKDDPMQVVTGYEVYLKRADRSGKYAGLKSWTTGSVETNDLIGHVKIYRKDWTEPLEHEADYKEYVQMKNVYKDKVFVGKEPNTFWKNKPKTMIKKVAESQGFRKAFPDEFDGMPYTADEVIDQEKIIDIQSDNKMAEKPLSNGNSSIISNTSTSDDQKISEEQGTALLLILAKNGYNKQDLKEFIFFEYHLEKLSDICNKHLPKIKEYFSKKKEQSNEKFRRVKT